MLRFFHIFVLATGLVAATNATAQVTYLVTNKSPLLDFRIRINYVDAFGVTFVYNFSVPHMQAINEPMPGNCVTITSVSVAPPLSTEFMVAGCNGRAEIQATWTSPPNYACPPHHINLGFSHFDCTGCMIKCPALCGTPTCNNKGVDIVQVD